MNIDSLKQSLADINADIERVQKQMKEVVICPPGGDQRVATIFNFRSYTLKEMLDDLRMKKLDIELQIRELEE